MRIWPTKRGWKRIGIGFALLIAFALLANGTMAWWTEHRLQTRIAAIRASGDPASLADLTPQPIPAAQNAAAGLAKLRTRLEEFGKDEWHFFDKTDLGKDYDHRREHGQMATADELDVIRKLLDNYQDLDVGLTAVTECGQYASLADYSLDSKEYLEQNLKDITRVRTAARYLSLQMEWLTANGKPDDAVKQGIKLLKLARLYDHEPLTINMLVAIALRGIAAEPLYDALASGTVSPEMRRAIDNELALHEDRQRLLRATKTERAYSIDSMKTFPAMGSRPPSWVMAVLGWPLKRYYIGAIDYDDAILAGLAKPQAAGGGAAGHPWNLIDPVSYGPFATLMVPALEAAYNADARCTAQLRALRIFNALQQYAEQNKRDASGLQDLPLPNEATIDPFDGKPLKLKHTEDGWIVYSVMTNGVDDGGDFVDLKDFGVAPPKYRLTYRPDEEAVPSDKETEKSDGAETTTP